tara:strand:+ start:2306 stop:2491 length:186 start_codon:yes stop_codon:yes gene_type:complete
MLHDYAHLALSLLGLSACSVHPGMHAIGSMYWGISHYESIVADFYLYHKHLGIYVYLASAL